MCSTDSRSSGDLVWYVTGRFVLIFRIKRFSFSIKKSRDENDDARSNGKKNSFVSFFFGNGEEQENTWSSTWKSALSSTIYSWIAKWL